MKFKTILTETIRLPEFVDLINSDKVYHFADGRELLYRGAGANYAAGFKIEIATDRKPRTTNKFTESLIERIRKKSYPSYPSRRASFYAAGDQIVAKFYGPVTMIVFPKKSAKVYGSKKDTYSYLKEGVFTPLDLVRSKRLIPVDIINQLPESTVKKLIVSRSAELKSEELDKIFQSLHSPDHLLAEINAVYKLKIANDPLYIYLDQLKNCIKQIDFNGYFKAYKKLKSGDDVYHFEEVAIIDDFVYAISAKDFYQSIEWNSSLRKWVRI